MPLFECPTDMEQRTGRIERQGNENEKVKIFRYVTDKSFDAYLYQILECKQRFISQIMTSKTPERTCVDIDEQALDYAEVKALCAGNSLIKREMDLQGKIKDLKMEKSRYSERIYEMQDNIRVKYPTQMNLLTANIEKSQKDYEMAINSAEVLVVEGKPYDVSDGKKEGGDALRAALNDPKNTSEAVSRQVTIGEYRGLKLSMLFDDLTKIWKGCLEGNKPHYFEFNVHTDTGNLIRMDNCIKNIADETKRSEEKLETLGKELEQMKIDVEKPFAKTEELRSMEAELDDVHMQLTKFTLTDDSMNKDMFERLVDTFAPVLTGDVTYQKYESEGFEPLVAEMEGDILTIAHTYVQNGDLMWDPRINFKVDYENKKVTPISYENSGTGIYEEYDTKNLTPETAEKINDLLEFTDMWLDNIEAQGYEPVDIEERVQNRQQGIAI